MKIVGSRTLRAACFLQVDLYELALLSRGHRSALRLTIHILGRYTYYMSAAQAERRVARSLSKVAMQLTLSPAKSSICWTGARGVAVEPMARCDARRIGTKANGEKCT